MQKDGLIRILYVPNCLFIIFEIKKEKKIIPYEIFVLWLVSSCYQLLNTLSKIVEIFGSGKKKTWKSIRLLKTNSDLLTILLSGWVSPLFFLRKDGKTTKNYFEKVLEENNWADLCWVRWKGQKAAVTFIKYSFVVSIRWNNPNNDGLNTLVFLCPPWKDRIKCGSLKKFKS